MHVLFCFALATSLCSANFDGYPNNSYDQRYEDAARSNGSEDFASGDLDNDPSAYDGGNYTGENSYNDGGRYNDGGTYDDGSTYNNGSTYNDSGTYNDGAAYDNWDENDAGAAALGNEGYQMEQDSNDTGFYNPGNGNVCDPAAPPLSPATPAASSDPAPFDANTFLPNFMSWLALPMPNSPVGGGCGAVDVQQTALSLGSTPTLDVQSTSFVAMLQDFFAQPSGTTLAAFATQEATGLQSNGISPADANRAVLAFIETLYSPANALVTGSPQQTAWSLSEQNGTEATPNVLTNPAAPATAAMLDDWLARPAGTDAKTFLSDEVAALEQGGGSVSDAQAAVASFLSVLGFSGL